MIAAKLAIADILAIPLARMPDDDRAYIDSILAEMLNRSEVLARISEYYRNRQSNMNRAASFMPLLSAVSAPPVSPPYSFSVISRRYRRLSRFSACP